MSKHDDRKAKALALAQSGALTKKWLYHGSNTAEQEFLGEGDTTRECAEDANGRGSATCHTFPNPYHADNKADDPIGAAEKQIEAAAEKAAEVIDRLITTNKALEVEVVEARKAREDLASLVVAGYNDLKVAHGLPEEDPKFVEFAKGILAK